MGITKGGRIGVCGNGGIRHWWLGQSQPLVLGVVLC